MWTILLIGFITIHFCVSGPPESSYHEGPNLRPFYIPLIIRENRKCVAAIPGEKLPNCEFVLSQPEDGSDEESRLMCFALYDALYQLCHLQRKFTDISSPDGLRFCYELPSILSHIHHYSQFFRGWALHAKHVLSDPEMCDKLCLVKGMIVKDTCKWIWSAHYILKNKHTLLNTPKTSVTNSQLPDKLKRFDTTAKIPISTNNEPHIGPLPKFDSNEYNATREMAIRKTFYDFFKPYFYDTDVRRILSGSEEAEQRQNISKPQAQDASTSDGFEDGMKLLNAVKKFQIELAKQKLSKPEDCNSADSESFDNSTSERIGENKTYVVSDEADEIRNSMGSGSPAVPKWYTNAYFLGLSVVLLVFLVFLVGVYVKKACIEKADSAPTERSSDMKVYSSELAEMDEIVKLL